MSSIKIIARKFAKRLREENKKGRSYRKIAKDFSGVDKNGKPLIKAGTLNRIAKGKGEWLPKSEKILEVLGLIVKPKPRSPFAVLPKWFNRTDEALSFYNGQRAKVKEMSRSTRDEMLKAKGIR